MEKMRTNKKLFKNDFQNEATLVIKLIKANTWQACLSRHHWSARVLFPFCRWEVLENEKRKNGENAHQFFFCQKRFSERGHSRNEIWKSKHVASLSQPPPLICACSFFISFVRSARIWKMKQTEKKAHQANTFRNDFQNEAKLVMKNERANTWRACHSRHRWCARVLFPFLRWEVLENENWKIWEKKAHQIVFFQMIFRTRPLS